MNVQKPLENFSIEDSALEKVAYLINKEKDLNNPFLRIMVETGGCAGLKYHIILDDYLSEENDLVFKNDDKIVLVIDEYSLEYVKNGTLKFEEDLEFSGFKIDNPNLTGSCNCGTSFSCSGSK